MNASSIPTRQFARLIAASDAEIVAETPILRAIDMLLSHETDNARWLRERGPAIARAHAEMIAEREAEALSGDIRGGGE